MRSFHRLFRPIRYPTQRTCSGSVRETLDWESWIRFFLTSVQETAEQAASTARRIVALLDADRPKVAGLGRVSASALQVFHFMHTAPIFSLTYAAYLSILSEGTEPIRQVAAGSA